MLQSPLGVACPQRRKLLVTVVAPAYKEAHTHVLAHLDAAKKRGDASVVHTCAGHLLDKVGVAASLLQSLKLGEGCSATAAAWSLQSKQQRLAHRRCGVV